MIDLLLDIATLDEARMRRRIFGYLFAFILPILFLGLFVVWASILAFVWLSDISSDLVASAVMCGASLVLAIVAMLALRRGGRRHRGFREALVDRLAETSDGKGGGASDDLLAIALIIANHLGSQPERKA